LDLSTGRRNGRPLYHLYYSQAGGEKMKQRIESHSLVIILLLRLPIIVATCTILITQSVLATPIGQEISDRNNATVDAIESEILIKNLQVFAKLYGYVKFFHPSDEASSMDWERFAIHGVEYVKVARNQNELKQKLMDLFHPIAPTVKIYDADEQPPEPHPLLTHEDTVGLKLVAWQHRGVGYGNVDYYQSIRLNRPTEEVANPLFDEHPEAGEVVERFLGRNLAAQIPLALFSNDSMTLRPKNAPPLSPLAEMLQAVPLEELTGADEALRYAGVVIAWNIFQHFYPYFDEVDVNWDDVLYSSLRKASEDRTEEDFLNTLKWMVVQLNDGHGYVRLHEINEYASLPFIIREIEGELMVTSDSNDVEVDTCPFRFGDRITSINGKPADQWFEKARNLISGTPQWKTALALSELTFGLPGESFHFILSRPGDTVVCDVTRENEYSPQPAGRLNPIERIREDIYYVDLTRASMEDIEEKAHSLAAAKGIIFDHRGYPNSNHGVLQHLSKDTLRSAHWQVPLQIYPDQMEIVAYDTSGRWTLEPNEPYFPGKIVYLINKNVISYGESVMGIVEHYELAEMVGETTAGTNGGVNNFTLPGGYNVWWTGMRVVKHDYL
jgi:hypothetical protein